MINNSKKIGQKFEEKFIKTINSGAFFRDHDAISDDEMLEIKYTEKKGFRITTEILNKLWNDSLDNNKMPILGIGIKEDNKLWMLKVQVTKEVI